MVTNNILESVKAECGISIDSDNTAFDDQLIDSINTVVMALDQMNVGTKGFIMVDGTETWDQLIPDPVKYSGIKTYVKIKTHMLFDPKSFTPNTMKSAEEVLREIEWRLNYKADAEEHGLIT